jgi:Flp pilus assembly protein TadD
MKPRRSRRRQHARSRAAAGQDGFERQQPDGTVADDTETTGPDHATDAGVPPSEPSATATDEEPGAGTVTGGAADGSGNEAANPQTESRGEERRDSDPDQPGQVSMEGDDPVPGDEAVPRDTGGETDDLRHAGRVRHDHGASRHGYGTADRLPSKSAYSGAGSSRPADPLAQARELEQAGQVDRAMNLYREILRTQPDNLEAHFALGSLHEKIGQHLQALEQFEMAKRSDPENVDAAVRHARAMAVLGRYDAAERELRRAARMDPTRSEVFTSLGTIGVRRGLYAQAEQDLKRAIELDSESPAAHHYRGEALNQLGRVDEALGMLEQAARLDPTNPRTYYVMGIVLDKKQRPQEAGAMFRRSRELTPG